MELNDLEYEAFERFCIMAEQSGVGEVVALKYINEKYGQQIAAKIWKYSKGK